MTERLEPPRSLPGRCAAAVVLALLLAATGAHEARLVEAVALDGRPLPRPALSPERRAHFEAKLAEAREAWERAPGADTLVWLGRRTAYLGRYREAIDHFSEGVRRWPEDARFLRHRGHRWITVRRFDRAVRDLAAAARRVEGSPDRVEPDGLPNARGIPTSTMHTNIFYHLGLAHYLRGEDAAALAAYERCLAAARNPDMEAAARYWLYLTQQRLGLAAAAAANLAAVDAGWVLIEDEAYHRLLLLYRGDLEPAALTAAGGDPLEQATLAYGLVRWHEIEGRPGKARALRERLLAGDQWASFGYLAAEADRHRSEHAPGAGAADARAAPRRAGSLARTDATEMKEGPR